MQPTFTPEFIIYKDGVTDGRTTILSQDGKPFNRSMKIQKYLMLGYEVYDLDGTPVNGLPYPDESASEAPNKI